mmetsp:Transcript_2812/g.5011  ORF Transcript_2812/g.5011 Transcript_2812/m.5011 type:complete len:197 (-) Transcript_2812:260-850(-)
MHDFWCTVPPNTAALNRTWRQLCILGILPMPDIPAAQAQHRPSTLALCASTPITKPSSLAAPLSPFSFPSSSFCTFRSTKPRTSKAPPQPQPLPSSPSPHPASLDLRPRPPPPTLIWGIQTKLSSPVLLAKASPAPQPPLTLITNFVITGLVSRPIGPYCRTSPFSLFDSILFNSPLCFSSLLPCMSLVPHVYAPS